MEKQHAELAQKVDELTTAARVQDAKTTLAKVTPIKGGSYEDQVHALMYGVAAGLGDEYAETGATVGRLARCKKGDGLLAVPGRSARVVLEMTDSPRTGWGDYLDEAERNRCAAASLGLVRTIEQNGGQSIRVLGPRRIVMAFDPEHDDPSCCARSSCCSAPPRSRPRPNRRNRDRHGRGEDRRGGRAARQDRRDQEVPASSPSTPRRSTASVTASTRASAGCSTRRSPRWERSMTRSTWTTTTSLSRKPSDCSLMTTSGLAAVPLDPTAIRGQRGSAREAEHGEVEGTRFTEESAQPGERSDNPASGELDRVPGEQQYKQVDAAGTATLDDRGADAHGEQVGRGRHEGDGEQRPPQPTGRAKQVHGRVEGHVEERK